MTTTPSPTTDPTIVANTVANNAANYGTTPVSPSQFLSATGLDVSGTHTPPTDTGTGLVAGAKTVADSVKDYLSASDAADKGVGSGAKTAYDTTSTDLGNLYNQDTGRGQAQLDAEAAAGLPGMNQGLLNINNDILTKSAEYDKINSDYEAGASSKGITTTVLMGHEAAVQRQRASDIGLLTARAQAMQGNITLAQNTANRSVDLKYQDIESQITAKQKQLDLLKPTLDKEETKKANAVQYALDQQKTKVADDKQTEKDINGIRLTLANKGVDPSIIDGATSLQDAITKAGKSLADNNNQILTLKNADGSDRVVLVDKTNGKIVRVISGGGGNTDNTSTPTSIVRTVTDPNGNTKPVSGYSLKAGDDPYAIAKQNGTDMAALQTLNPQITDWHNLKPGTVINLPNTTETWLNGKTPDQIAAYNALPDDTRASYKQLINGGLAFSKYISSRGIQSKTQKDQVIKQIQAIDPSWSPAQSDARVNYLTKFTDPNGKDQTQVTAINTALGHLAEFKTNADALNNTKFTDYNGFKNWAAKHTGDPRVAKLDIVINALAGELASVYKSGGAPTDQETAAWRNSIMSSFSQSQTKGVADTTSDLISNKLLSLNNAYKNVMGSYPTNSIVNADVLTQLQGAGVDVSGITGKLQAAGYSTPTAVNSSKSLLDNWLGGTTTSNSNSQLEALWNQ